MVSGQNGEILWGDEDEATIEFDQIYMADVPAEIEVYEGQELCLKIPVEIDIEHEHGQYWFEGDYEGKVKITKIISNTVSEYKGRNYREVEAEIEKVRTETTISDRK